MKRLNSRSLYNVLFLDKNGRFVVAQSPNLLLMIWLVTLTIGILVNDESTKTILKGVGSISLIIWALLEVYSDVNMFRKLLGSVILVSIILNHFIK